MLLAGNAIIASEVKLSVALTGTWTSLTVTHEESDFQGGYTAAKKTVVSTPIVLIGDKASSVLGNIEDAGRAALKVSCAR